MKCTRQRCQVAESTLAAAAFSPSWASEMTSLTPRRPRRVSERKNLAQNGSAADGRHAENLTTPVAVDADSDYHGNGGDPPALVDPQVGPAAFDRPLEERLTGSSISAHSRDTWLLEMPVMPMALTRSSTEGVDMPCT